MEYEIRCPNCGTLYFVRYRSQVQSPSVCPLCYQRRMREFRIKAAYVPGCLGDCIPHAQVLLHIFFRSIEETEEQLARLAWDSGRPRRAEPAVSKIEKTQLVEISPINAIAARVVRDRDE